MTDPIYSHFLNFWKAFHEPKHIHNAKIYCTIAIVFLQRDSYLNVLGLPVQCLGSTIVASWLHTCHMLQTTLVLWALLSMVHPCTKYVCLYHPHLSMYYSQLVLGVNDIMFLWDIAQGLQYYKWQSQHYAITCVHVCLHVSMCVKQGYWLQVSTESSLDWVAKATGRVLPSTLDLHLNLLPVSKCSYFLLHQCKQKYNTKFC